MQDIEPRDLPYTLEIDGKEIEFDETNAGNYYAECDGSHIGYFELYDNNDSGIWVAGTIGVADAFKGKGIATELHLIALWNLHNYSLPAWDLSNNDGMSTAGKAFYMKMYEKDLLTDSQKKEMDNFNQGEEEPDPLDYPDDEENDGEITGEVITGTFE